MICSHEESVEKSIALTVPRLNKNHASSWPFLISQDPRVFWDRCWALRASDIDRFSSQGIDMAFPAVSWPCTSGSNLDSLEGCRFSMKTFWLHGVHSLFSFLPPSPGSLFLFTFPTIACPPWWTCTCSTVTFWRPPLRHRFNASN